MSLKSFHMFFITASLALCMLLGLWSAYQLKIGGFPGATALLISSGIGGAALLYYSTWFRRRYRSSSL